MRVLVTGSSGFLGQRVCGLLRERGHVPVEFDLPHRDVRQYGHVASAKAGSVTYWAAGRIGPADACIHLAGMKYADRGEVEVFDAVDTNVIGTNNVLRAFGPNAVIASTCKAADPETVYGATKLICERMALNAGARVVRLVNVLGSAGSVTDIWRDVPEDEPLPVADATRLFIGADEATRLFVDALDWPTGRYASARDYRRSMWVVAQELFPGRGRVEVPLRRGDRQHERLLASCETLHRHDARTFRIVGQHDPPPERKTRCLPTEAVSQTAP